MALLRLKSAMGTTMQDDNMTNHIDHSEKFVRAMATRYGFRSRELSLVWDDGELEPDRNQHQLTIIVADGRRSAAQIEHTALVRENPWRYFGDVDAALLKLTRRDETRGL